MFGKLGEIPTATIGPEAPTQPADLTVLTVPAFRILFAAIQDYRSGRDHEREDARKFLYPCTCEYSDHFDWAVAMTDGVDRMWLRGALDKLRIDWDVQWQRTMKVQ